MSVAEVPLSEERPGWNVRKRWIGQIVLTLLLLVFTALVLIPFVWMIVISLRTSAGIFANPYGFPWEFRWQNYYELFFNAQIRFYRFYYNSIFVTFFTITILTVLATMAGFGFGRSRYDFPGRETVFYLLLFALMLPPQVLYIPQFIMMSRYNLLDTKWSLVLLYTAMQLPVSTFLMRAYFSQLPSEIEDAARIDGCNDLRMFWQVMLPMARPGLATIWLLGFIYAWNELLLAMTMVTNPANRTLPVAMMNFIGEFGANYALAAASLVSAMLPLLIAYLFLSERFIEGMTAGAVKA